MNIKFYLRALLIVMAFAATVVIIADAISHPMMGQALPSNSGQPMQQPIPLTPEETAQWQILALQLENLRLAVCLRAGAISNECGAWGRGAVVMRTPKQVEKPPEPSAAVPENLAPPVNGREGARIANMPKTLPPPVTPPKK